MISSVDEGHEEEMTKPPTLSRSQGSATRKFRTDQSMAHPPRDCPDCMRSQSATAAPHAAATFVIPELLLAEPLVLKELSLARQSLR